MGFGCVITLDGVMEAESAVADAIGGEALC